MTTYVFRDGLFVNKATGEPSKSDPNWVPTVPMIIPDITPHRGPGGIYIGSRSAQRDFVRNSDWSPYERVGAMTSAPQGVFDEKNENWAAWHDNIKQTVAARAGLDKSVLDAKAAEAKAQKAETKARATRNSVKA